MRSICNVDGCESLVKAKGLCAMHYNRQRNGSGVCKQCGGSRPLCRGRTLCDACRNEQCKIEGCSNQVKTFYLGLCDAHYARYKRGKMGCEDCGGVAPLMPGPQLCIECRDRRRTYSKRLHWIKKRFGLTPEEYDAVLARGCAICGTHESLGIDHDHAVGSVKEAVRDALCRTCNSMLGMARDDPERLRLGAAYLENHRAESKPQLRLVG